MAGFTTRPEILGTFGVVTTTHWVATAIGMATLEKGGNAFDAAAAVGLALQVVEPHLNGPAGEAPIIVYDVKRGKPEVICGQGVAPASASMEKFAELDLDLIPGTGLLPATVPGAFDAWMLLLRNYGTMKLADVLAPTITLARDGYPVVARIGETIQSVQELFQTHWPTSADVYLPGGKPFPAGSIQTNKTMAATYQRILNEAESVGGDREAQIEAARKAWSQGFVAEAIDTFCRTQDVFDVTGRTHKGLLTGQDMANWQASIEAPATLDYDNYTICKCGAWSQGPVMLQQLALLHGYQLDGMDPTSADWVHTLVECAKLAYADRDTFYGDPDFTDVPLDTLLSTDYNGRRRAMVQLDASMEFRPGSIEGLERSFDYDGATNRKVASGVQGAGEPTVSKMGETVGDTVHLDIIDRDGNMVSSTPSGGWLFSSPVIPELGFPLGTRGQMFWLDEKSPSALVPGKRPRSTLSPGMVLRDGEAYMALGSPGGDQQDQWATQLFVRHVHADMNLQEGIDCPAFHTEHFPSSFWPRKARPGVVVVEGRMPKETVKELERRGHIVEVGDDWSEGRLTAAARDGKILKAAANPRGMQGYAIGR